MIIKLKKIITFLFISTYISACYSQNFLDFNNAIKFADYLYNSGQYQFAAEEYERAYFINPSYDSLETKILKSYRFTENYQAGIHFYETAHSDSLYYSSEINSIEYFKLLILQSSINKADTLLINSKNLSPVTKINLELCLQILENKNITLLKSNYSAQYINPKLWELLNEKYMHKSPLLAISMSALIPGSGKIYTGNWKDGMATFFIIGLSAFNSYRGFSQKGIKSIYGWTFATISFGFYCGNLYGSFKSAKKYNDIYKKNICNKVIDIMCNSF
jgi:hypothetical protein